jgi:hypothetical protein
MFLLASPALCEEPSGDRSGVFEAGAYSFSDELGGFRVVSASGTGTKADPIVVAQELVSASPVILVIRTPGQVFASRIPGNPSLGFIHLQMDVLNNSGQAWIEFEFELQEILGKASVFSDGLSFDQRRSASETISSDRFAEFSRDFEPYDRLLFQNGKVDPLDTVSFTFLVTDFTPRAQFYLVLDPRIPSSEPRACSSRRKVAF